MCYAVLQGCGCMEKDKIEKMAVPATAEERVGGFLLKYRRVLLFFVCAVVLAAAGYCAVIVATEKATEKGLSALDAISFQLTNKSSDLSESDISARRDKALEQLAGFTSKRGAVGSRANMLAADILYQKRDYKNALDAWLAAAHASEKSYTAPLSYFNAAVCGENIGDLDSAIEYYQKASDSEEFYEASHALFSIARIKEGQKEYSSASEFYQKVVDKNTGDSWAAMAKSRLIAMRIAGYIQ